MTRTWINFAMALTLLPIASMACDDGSNNDDAAATDGPATGGTAGDGDGADDGNGDGADDGNGEGADDGNDDAADDGNDDGNDDAADDGNDDGNDGETGNDGNDGETGNDGNDGETGMDDAMDDGGNAAGTVDVNLTGCSVDFSGDIVVSYNGSLGVASVVNMGGALTGSFQFDLDGPDTFTLSTQHRVDTGTVINLVDPGQGTWTNLDSDALAPDGVDTISGVLDVSTWNPASGQATIEFTGVTLRNVGSGSICTIDGTIETTELYP